VVLFRLIVSDTSSHIDRIRRVGHTMVPASAPPPRPQPVPEAAAPEVALRDDSGKSLHLSDFRGRAVAFTFIFTRCPLPDFCPLMSHQFAEVARSLRQETPERWALLSITMDPEYDTPTVLAAYAGSYRPPGLAEQWRFATGDPREIRKLAEFAGVATRGEGAALQHTLRTVVLGPDGTVRKIFSGNGWKPAELTAVLREEMAR
jgi:protein SCO1/2